MPIMLARSIAFPYYLSAHLTPGPLAPAGLWRYYTNPMDTLKRILVLILVALTVATVYNGIFYLFYKLWRH